MPHLDLDGTRITELARRAEITKQAVGQLVSDMERAGYVERFADPDDQRAKIVKLTQRGRDAILDGLTVFSELAAELGGAVGEGEIDRLVDGLETLMRALERRMV
jgi:DNA-binding MarR family transcriptional regulator